MQTESEAAGQAQFGAWLRDLRKERRLTREELAGLVGCAYVTLEKIESGTRRPSRQMAALLATHLAIPAELQPLFADAARGAIEDIPPQLRALTTAKPSRRAPARPPGNLPVPASSFVGREIELAATNRLLDDPGVRLLTVLGPGGVGKTHFAIRLAGEISARFPDGVFFVALAGVSVAEDVLQATGAAVGVAANGSRPLLAAITGRLKNRKCLLVFDNFEHVLDAAPAVAALLAACPQLKALVTSRAALRLGGEHEYALPSLALPPSGMRLNEAVASQYDGLRLFAERARQIDREFALDDDNAATVAAICRQLDGLPLAIELATALIRVLSPEQMLEKLQNRLVLLDAGAAGLPRHHATLRATLDWSYNLLAAAEQRLLSKLAVFVGGCDFDAAVAVSAAPQDAVLAALAALVSKSLLKRSLRRPGGPRFWLLETTREYARERLQASGDLLAAQRAHAAYYLQLAESAQGGLEGKQQNEWYNRLELEHGNIRAALDWLLGQGDGDAVFRIGTALHRYWRYRAHAPEAINWLQRALALNASASDEAALRYRADAYSQLGWLHVQLHQFGEARQMLQQSIAMWRRLGDKRGLSTALLGLGAVAQGAQELEEAEAPFAEALALHRDLSESGEIARILNWLGIVACDRGDFASSRDWHRQSLRLWSSLDDELGQAYAIIRLGCTELSAGCYAAAIPYFEDALARFRRCGDVSGEGFALDMLAYTALHLGDYEQALARNRATLADAWATGLVDFAGATLLFFARVAYRRGQIEQAAWIVGHWRSLDLPVGFSMIDVASTAADLAGIEARVAADPALAQTARRGELTPTEEVVALLINGAATPLPAPAQPPTR